MPTLDEYSQTICYDDTGRWSAAVHQAADLVGADWDARYAEEPEQEVPLQVAALLVYAIAAEQDIAPAEVDLARLGDWFATVRQHPAALGPQARLERELRAAGHDLPYGVNTSTTAAPVPGDPVARTWAGLVNWQTPAASPIDSWSYPGPHLSWGLDKVEKAVLRSAPA